MIRLRNVIISGSSVIDKETGNLSIFEVIGVLSTPMFPVTLNKMTINVILKRDDKDETEGEIELIIKRKNAADLHHTAPYSFKNAFGKNVLETSLGIRIHGLEIEEPGVIEAIVRHNDITYTDTISIVQGERWKTYDDLVFEPFIDCI
jgi:hypothetical protein